MVFGYIELCGMSGFRFFGIVVSSLFEEGGVFCGVFGFLVKRRLRFSWIVYFFFLDVDG